MLRAMRRTANAPQRPFSERTASLRAMLSIKRSAICCEQCAGLQTLRSVRIKSGPDRLEPCLALSARRYAASNAQDCRRSAASGFRAHRIASQIAYALQAPFRSGPDRFEPCLALSAWRYAAKKCNPGHCLQHNFCGSFQFTLERHEEWSTDDVVQEKKKRII